MAAVRRAPPWFSRPALSVLVAALAGGCLADSTAPNPPPADQISAVVVSAPSQVLAPGDTIRLTAQVMDANGRVLPNEPVTWSSSNPAAATVDAQGLVTADTVGATTISAVARGKRGTLDFSVQVTVLCDCLKIFDSTDVRLISRNDTTGLYLFRVVQGPPPTLDSADILVGQEDGGYLRKVVSSNLSAGVLTVQTSTAYVEDAVRDGEFATTSFSDDESGTPAPGSTWWGPWTTTYMAPGVSLNQAGFCCSLNGLQASIKFGTRASGTVQFTIVDGEIVFAPRIQLGAKFGFFKLKRFHAIFRGDLGLNLNQYEIKVTAACCSLSDSVQQKLTKESVRFIQQQRPFATFIGPMPIIGRIIKRISLQITPTVAASAIFTGRFRTGFGLTAGARYTSGSGWRPVSGTSSYFDATAPAFSGIEGSASIKIAVVPEFFVEFYGVGGPFVNVEPYAEAAAAVQALFDSNHDYTALDWETRVDLGINLNLGLRLSLMGLTNLEAAFAIPLIQPYRLIQAYSDGDLTVGNLSTGQDIPASYQVQLRPIFTPTDPPLGRKHTTSTQDVVLPANDTIVLPDVRSGPKYTHTLKLTGVQGNCTATNPKLDTMQVNSDLMQTFGGSPTDTLFSVDCIPLGDMQVSAVTNGPDQPARYFVSVKRQDTVGVGKGDSAIVFGIPSGPAAPVPVPGLFLAPVSTDTVLEDFIPVNPRNGATGLTAATLNPGRRNCATARPATNQVVIQSGDTVGTQFAVTCVPLGHIQVLSPTADPDPPPVSDTVRYLPLVVPQDAIDTVASPPGRLVAGDSTIVNGLVPLYNASGAPGRYTVRLSGAPNRCTEAAGFSRTVTVLPGDTAIAGYAVRCVERLHVATATTGPGTDLDGYDIVIENQDGTADTVRTGLNDTAHIAGVSPGPHTIRLADVETSCLAPAQVTPTISGLDSTLLRFQVSCPAPPPPGGLRTTLVTTSQIDIAWDSAGPDSVIAGYRIYRNGALYDSTAATAYSDPGLPAFTSFTYRISSVNRTGLEGARSGPLVVRTRDATPPTAPAALTATPVSGTRINLGWSAATDPETGVARYRIYRDGILTDSTAATAYADTGLVPSTLYSYQVAAVNPDGLEGPRSPAAQATTLDVTPPSAPGSLSATAVSASRIDLSWSAASDPESGVIRYNVYRNGIQAGTATGTSFSDVNLVPNTAYSYTVTAVNGAALEGPPSQPATATTLPDPSPPTAPTGLSASPVSSSRIDLSWNAAGDPESGVSRYRIYRDGLLADSSTTTSYADTGLTPSTTYTYTVSAVNGAGLEGPASAPAGATTPGDLTPPTAPTGLTATATGTSSIDLAWTAASDPETGIARYRIYRDGALVDSTGGTGFSDAGLTPATAYTYEVSAVNGAGLEGPRSQPATATTLPVVTTGELLVNVTTGGTIPQNPFEVLLEGSVRRTAPVTPNGTALFTGLTPGAYEVRLRNLAAGCAVTPPNPRGTTIVAGQQTQTTFAVTCQ